MIAARGYLVSTCWKNIEDLFDLPMEYPTSMKERVQEQVDHDTNCFADTELDDVSGTSKSSLVAEYVVADSPSMMKDERMTGSASIFHMCTNYRHYLDAVL